MFFLWYSSCELLLFLEEKINKHWKTVVKIDDFFLLTLFGGTKLLVSYGQLLAAELFFTCYLKV